MNISRKIMLSIAVLSLGIFVIIWSAPNGRKVSLLFHGIETNRDGLAARIEFTNSTRRAVGYEGNSYRPEYRLMEAEYGGWKETDNTARIIHMGTMASVPRPRTLLPSCGVVFQAWIPHGQQEIKQRKVEVTYSYTRPTNGLWKVMPKWIWTRLPWGKDNYTVESPTFTL